MLEEGAVINYDGYGLMVFSGSFLMVDNETPDSLESLGVPLYGEELFKGSGLFVSKISKRFNPDKTISLQIEAIGIEKRYKGRTAISIEGANSCSMEPIETHPDFKSKIGGTPSRRLNGATFDKDGKFTGFKVLESLDPQANENGSITSNQPLAGVRSYLAPKQTFRGMFHIEAKQLNIVQDWLNRMSGTHSKTGEWMGMTLLPDYIRKQQYGDYLLTSITPENVVVTKDGEPVIVKVTYEVLKARGEWNNVMYIDSQTSQPSG